MSKSSVSAELVSQVALQTYIFDIMDRLILSYSELKSSYLNWSTLHALLQVHYFATYILILQEIASYKLSHIDPCVILVVW